MFSALKFSFAVEAWLLIAVTKIDEGADEVSLKKEAPNWKAFTSSLSCLSQAVLFVFSLSQTCQREPCLLPRVSWTGSRPCMTLWRIKRIKQIGGWMDCSPAERGLYPGVVWVGPIFGVLGVLPGNSSEKWGAIELFVFLSLLVLVKRNVCQRRIGSGFKS